MTFPIRTTINAFGPAISWGDADRPGQYPGREAPFAAPRPSPDRAHPGSTAGAVDHAGLGLGLSLAAGPGLEGGVGLSLSTGVGLALKLGLDLSLGPRAGGPVMPPAENGTDLDPAVGQATGMPDQAPAGGGPMRPLPADPGADHPTAPGQPARLTAARADTGATRVVLPAGNAFNAPATGGPGPRAGLVAGIGVRIGADQPGTAAGPVPPSGTASGGIAAAAGSAKKPAGTAREPGSAHFGPVPTGGTAVHGGMARQDNPRSPVFGAAGLSVDVLPAGQAPGVAAPVPAMPAPAGTDVGLSPAASASTAPALSLLTGRPSDLLPEAKPVSTDDATGAITRVQTLIPQFLTDPAMRPTESGSPPAEIAQEIPPTAEVRSAEAASSPAPPQLPSHAPGAGEPAPAHPTPVSASAQTDAMPANPRKTVNRNDSDGPAPSADLQPLPVATAALAGPPTASALPQHPEAVQATGREAALNPLQAVRPDPAASPASAFKAAAAGQTAPDAAGNGGAGLPLGSLTALPSPSPAPTVAPAANSVPLVAGVLAPTALGGPAVLTPPVQTAGPAAQPLALFNPLLARRRGRRRDRANLHGLWSILYVMGWGRRRGDAEPDDEADHETDETDADPPAGRSASRKR